MGRYFWIQELQKNVVKYEFRLQNVLHYSVSWLDTLEKAINRQENAVDIHMDWNREGGGYYLFPKHMKKGRI